MGERQPRPRTGLKTMTESSMSHGRNWAGENLAGWAISEKLDGVRAYWDGETLWTRAGNVIPLPAVIRARLPVSHLDCELWGGRGCFGAACAAAKGNWGPTVRLVAFDAPRAPGDWTARMATLDGTNIDRVFPRVVASTEEAFRIAEEIIAEGGEGIVARKPGINYRAGRGTSTLKIKAAQIGGPAGE